jgi:3-methyladenine DNA glycosylase AlkD
MWCDRRPHHVISSPLDAVRAELAAAGDPARAAAQFRYLQMGHGGYGEGDRTLGVPVPVQRRIAARHWRAVSVPDAGVLLRSGLHEERLTAIFILVQRFRRGDPVERQAVYDLVLATTAHIDNWDLVDSLAPYVVGPWLADPARPSCDRSVLDRLAGSSSVWERRIAVMATFAFIRDGDYHWTLRLAQRLLHDPHDLIHKAVGWMLREVGNRDRAAEEAFLTRHYAEMPRVMLRYAIEKFDEPTRRRYLTGQV